MSQLFILKDRKPVLELDLLKWGTFYEKAERRVNSTRFPIIKKRALSIRRKRLKKRLKQAYKIYKRSKNSRIKWVYRYRLKGVEFGSVSTVFLGIDHGWGGEPKFFETMVFGGKYDQLQARCPDWDSAATMHHAVVNMIRGISPSTV